MNDYLDNVRPFINDIESKTREGSIHWKRINPSTLQWVKEVDSGRVRSTIQRVEGPKGEYYRFDVKHLDENEELISIDTRESLDIQSIIESLYYTAENYTFVNRSKRDAILQKLLNE